VHLPFLLEYISHIHAFCRYVHLDLGDLPPQEQTMLTGPPRTALVMDRLRWIQRHKHLYALFGKYGK